MIKTAGKYSAKVNDWGVKETKAGKPYVQVWFDVEGNGSVKWDGFMTEKTIEKTLKTLAMLGLKGPLETLADGQLGGALDRTIEVEIDVELKPDQKDPNKKWPQVKWVNIPRAAKFDAAVSAQAKGKLAQFSGQWIKVKSEMGIKKPTTDVGF